MKARPLTPVCLVFGFLLKLVSTVIMASRPSDSAAMIGLGIAVLSVLLWMTGSFLLAREWGLSTSWGWAGLLGLIGIVIMHFNRPKSRRRNTHRYPYDYDTGHSDEISADSEHEQGEQTKAPRYDY